MARYTVGLSGNYVTDVAAPCLIKGVWRCYLNDQLLVSKNCSIKTRCHLETAQIRKM